jgi:hypothetical protein
MKDQNAQDNRLAGNLMYIENNNPHPGRCQMRKPAHEHAAIGDTSCFSPAEIHTPHAHTFYHILQHHIGGGKDLFREGGRTDGCGRISI